jgi:hypothetical protein
MDGIEVLQKLLITSDIPIIDIGHGNRHTIHQEGTFDFFETDDLNRLLITTRNALEMGFISQTKVLKKQSHSRSLHLAAMMQ